MAYKIYVSTNDDNECRPYLAAIQRALFSLNESVISSAQNESLEKTKTLISQCDIFIGLYGNIYGEVPAGETASFIELEYQTATTNQIPVILFIMDGAKDTEDERQKAFLDHISHHHIITGFKDEKELESKVKMAVDRFSKTKGLRRLLTPPSSFMESAAPSLPKLRGKKDEKEQGLSDEEFAQYISKGFELGESDLERIIRRSLELHSAAQEQEQNKVLEDYDGKITVSPLWGEPARHTQFNSDIFMIMPFREQFDAIYKDVIQPVVAEQNLTIKRGDDFSSTQGSIINEVWAALNACKLVIVETTELNANVYYELGIAHTLGKPAILLTQTKDVQDLPFDIRHLRFVVYENTIEGSADLGERLRHSIIWLLNDLEEDEQK